jgi:hypothetical protein
VSLGQLVNEFTAHNSPLGHVKIQRVCPNILAAGGR